jgi:SAM-dependent methyltransferase
MPSAQENRDRWTHHKWERQGDEWSPGRSPEGTSVLWFRTVLPRIQRFVPTGTVLEIGPGFGRWTQYLRQLSRRLILVDVSERCIAACRERFGDDTHLEYFTNDGASLDMVPDRSVDFIFSFDSLVHAEADAVGAYLAQAARKLKPGGGGFIHHSNLGAFVHPRTGQVRRFVTRRNWRAESMSADLFRSLCEKAGLACRSQELINWIGGGRYADRHQLDGRCIPLTDCLSVFTTRETRSAAPTWIVNHAFVDEWRQAVWMADVYAKRDSSVASMPTTPERAGRLLHKVSTMRSVVRREGIGGAVALARERGAGALEFQLSRQRARMLGLANRWFTRRHLAHGTHVVPPIEPPPAPTSVAAVGRTAG